MLPKNRAQHFHLLATVKMYLQISLILSNLEDKEIMSQNNPMTRLQRILNIPYYHNEINTKSSKVKCHHDL